MNSLETTNRREEVVMIPDEDISKIESLRKEIKQKNGNVPKELYMEFCEVVDRITRGKFLDKKNVNHVMNATRNEKKDFNIHDEFEPGRLDNTYDGYSFFYFSIYGNIFASFNDGNKIIIFSPENQYLKRVLKVYIHRMLKQDKKMLDNMKREQLQRVKNFIDGKEQDLTSKVTSYDWGYIMLDIAKTFKLKWSQIADCVVELDEQKVYFFGNKSEK